MDCLKMLSSIKDSSIDYINCDPPYNIGYDGGGSWDSFGNENEYLNWCNDWIKELTRVLKPNRMMSIWGTQKTDTFFRLKLDILNNIYNLYGQSAVHWSYNWGGRTKSNFAHKFETAWCYSKGKKFYFDKTEIEINRKMKVNIRTGKEYTTGTIPTTIWEGNLGTTSKEARDSNFHPTVKPQFVLQRMINAYCPKDGIVLDIFSGSGSTALACAYTKRQFIGCEINNSYYKKSIQRIEKYFPRLDIN